MAQARLGSWKGWMKGIGQGLILKARFRDYPGVTEGQLWTNLSYNGRPRDLNMQLFRKQSQRKYELKWSQKFSNGHTHFALVDTVTSKDLQFFRAQIDKLHAIDEVNKVQYKLCFKHWIMNERKYNKCLQLRK
jgi:hypothetical protein